MRLLGKIAISSVIIIVIALGVACFTAGFGCQPSAFPANTAKPASLLPLADAIHDMAADRTLVQQQVAIGPKNIHPASVLPSTAPLGGSMPMAPQPANWNEQLGISFTQNFTSLAYNVIAVAQADPNGYGPAYLLNGLTSNGYWCQVGLSWNWPYASGGYNPGFNLNYEVFDSSGNSIFPTGGSGGLTSFSGTVNQGDTVSLSLSFSGGNVIMSAHDINSGASAQESYGPIGATYFEGTPSASSDSNGFFTGLMTEWYHVSQYYGGEASVIYLDQGPAVSSAWMWIDEFNANTGTRLFDDESPSPFNYSNPTQLQYFTGHGGTEDSNAYDFITGAGNWVQTTLSYSVVGGGTGYSAPTLTYTLGGVQYSASLSTSPTAYYMDSGSGWSVNNPLSGSTGIETWITKQQTIGTAGSNQSISITYYHQYSISLGYNVSGTGTGYSPPNATVVQFGSLTTVTVPIHLFADAGSQYSLQNPLLGSSPTERWFAASSQGIVSSSLSLQALYYLQYALNESYSIVGGGNPVGPNVTCTSLGSSSSIPLTLVRGTVWLDLGSAYNIPNTLSPSGSTERWFTSSPLAGSVSGPGTISQTYYHQYLVVFSYSVEGGGSPLPPLLNGTSLASPTSQVFGTAPSATWLDSGSSYAFNFLLNPSATERWSTNQTLVSGTVSAPATLSPMYIHQFFVAMESDSAAGGSISPASNWFDAGHMIQISAVANPRWEFENWNGSGASSYSGILNSTITIVNSPIVEYATFYPGLTINATSYGTVAYNYSLGSGSIPGSSSVVLYVPLNDSVLLNANPSSFVFQFKSWSGDAVSTAQQMQILASAPMAVQANFDFNWLNIGITVAVAAIALAVLALLIFRRKGARKPT